jgi:hypothetical protein
MNCDQPALLRKETTLPPKAIAARMHLGRSKGVNARLHEWLRSHPAAEDGGREEK